MRLIWNLIKIWAVLCLVAMIFALFKVLFDFLASYGLWILLFVIVLVLAYCLYGERDRFKRKPKPTMTIATLNEKKPNLEITTEQDYREFLDSHSLIRSFITKVVGVTYPNDDGTDRQEILSMCVSGEPVAFHWHTFRGAPACAVITDRGQIGYLSADLAADLDRDYNGDEYIFEGHISDILGGEDGLNYGCYIMLSIYGPRVVEENVYFDDADGDEMFPYAVDIVLETGQASVSMLQRRLHLGYTRSARLIDEMEEKGIIGPFRGSKPRELLITKKQWEQRMRE